MNPYIVNTQELSLLKSTSAWIHETYHLSQVVGACMDHPPFNIRDAIHESRGRKLLHTRGARLQWEFFIELPVLDLHMDHSGEIVAVFLVGNTGMNPAVSCPSLGFHSHSLHLLHFCVVYIPSASGGREGEKEKKMGEREVLKTHVSLLP